MKTLKTNDDVAHAWAHRHHDSAKTPNGNMSFVGSRVYSYTTCIGWLNRGYALLNRETYTPTTSSKHQPAVFASVNHIPTVYVFREPPKTDDYSDVFPFITLCIGDYIERLQRIKLDYKRARKAKNIHIARFETSTEQIERFITWASLWVEDKDLEAYQKALTPLRDEMAMPEEWARAREEYERQRLEYEREQTEWQLSEVKRWKSGERDQSVYGTPLAYLRLDSDHVLTSKGVRIPIQEALQGYLAFKRGKLLGQRLAGFTITQVDTVKEVVVAGCHTIPFSEIEEIGEKLISLNTKSA